MTKEEAVKFLTTGRVKSLINRKAIGYTKDYELSKDLVQDTLLKVVKNIHKFNESNCNQILGSKDSLFIGWVYRILFNTFVDNYSRKNIRNGKTYSLDYIMDESDNEKLNCTPKSMHYNDKGYDSFDYKLLHSKLDELKPYDKQLLLLVIERFSYYDIMDIMDIKTIGTVKTRIFLARKKFKQILDTNYGAHYTE